MPDARTSWNNLCSYSPDTAKKVAKKCNYDENVILSLMQSFLNHYKNGIRGHSSGKRGDKIHPQTDQDLRAFRDWYNKYH